MKTLSPDAFKLLLAGSISPLPLHKTLLLLEMLGENQNPRLDAHERLALARSLVNDISNLQFGPEVGVGPSKPDAPVVGPWLRGIKTIAEDLRQLRTKAPTPAIVHRADARDLALLLAPASVDAVITSPPYPNEKDYTRTTRLELLTHCRSSGEAAILAPRPPRASRRRWPGRGCRWRPRARRRSSSRG